MTTHIESDEILAGPDSRWLDRRVRSWEIAAIITSEQAEAIRHLERSRAGPETKAHRYQRLTAIVSVFGAVLIGIGLILFVGSNWADLPRLVKLALAAVVVGGFELSGFWVRYRAAHPRTGGALLFVGAAAYGAAIFLVAQMYNYPVDDPNLLLLWLLPVLPLAYLVRSQAIAALGIAVGYGALGYRAVGWIESVGGTIEAFGFQLLYLSVGAATAAVGFLHERSDRLQRMGAPFQWIGSFTVLAVVYLMSFEFWYAADFFERDGEGDVGIGLIVLVGLALVVVAATFIALHLSAAPDRIGPAKTAVGVTAAIGIATAIVMFATPGGNSLVPFALMNVVLLAAIVGFTFVGIGLRREALVNVALGAFVVAVITRYIEIGGGMFGTSVSMILGGSLLLGLGYAIERFRKTLIHRLRGAS